MSSSWVRVIIAAVVTVAALFLGLALFGSTIVGGTADANTGLVPG